MKSLLENFPKLNYKDVDSAEYSFSCELFGKENELNNPIESLLLCTILSSLNYKTYLDHVTIYRSVVNDRNIDEQECAEGYESITIPLSLFSFFILNDWNHLPYLFKKTKRENFKYLYGIGQNNNDNNDNNGGIICYYSKLIDELPWFEENRLEWKYFHPISKVFPQRIENQTSSVTILSALLEQDEKTIFTSFMKYFKK